MKKLFFLFIMSIILFAQNIFVPQNSYIVNTKTAQKYYQLKKVELETQALISLTKEMLSNEKFRKLSYLEEIGKTKVNTITILTALLNFLEGQKPYINTQFDNNSDEAGILKLIKDIENNTLLNFPQKTKEDILNSITTSIFFNMVNGIENLLTEVNKNNIGDTIKNFVSLFNQYVNDLNQINNSLIQDFNSQIQTMLLKDYRIEAKGAIVKIFEVFKKYLDINARIYY